MSKAFKVGATDITKNKLLINSHFLKASEVMFKQTLFYFNRSVRFYKYSIGTEGTIEMVYIVLIPVSFNESR
jgi:hypothetical protein